MILKLSYFTTQHATFSHRYWSYAIRLLHFYPLLHSVLYKGRLILKEGIIEKDSNEGSDCESVDDSSESYVVFQKSTGNTIQTYKWQRDTLNGYLE